MVTSFKEATGDMVMYSFEFVLYSALDEGKCQNMVRPADCGADAVWEAEQMCAPYDTCALSMTHVCAAHRCGSGGHWSIYGGFPPCVFSC